MDWSVLNPRNYSIEGFVVDIGVARTRMRRRRTGKAA
jgi:hypothetical protein